MYERLRDTMAGVLHRVGDATSVVLDVRVDVVWL